MLKDVCTYMLKGACVLTTMGAAETGGVVSLAGKVNERGGVINGYFAAGTFS